MNEDLRTYLDKVANYAADMAEAAGSGKVSSWDRQSLVSAALQQLCLTWALTNWPTPEEIKAAAREANAVIARAEGVRP